MGRKSSGINGRIYQRCKLCSKKKSELTQGLYSKLEFFIESCFMYSTGEILKILFRGVDVKKNLKSD